MKEKIKIAILSLSLIICLGSESKSVLQLSPSYVSASLFSKENRCSKDFCREPDDGETLKMFCEKYRSPNADFLAVGRAQYQGEDCSCPCVFDYLAIKIVRTSSDR